jgi:hypothetical protein
MKTTFIRSILLITLFAASQSLQAQSSIDLPEDFQLGLRFGDTFGSSFTLDAMTPFLGETLHANLGFEDGLAISAIYDIKRSIVDSFYWYYGAGGEVGFFDEFSLAIAGEVGIEYAIQEFPVTFGIDYRPAIGLIGRDEFLGGQYGVNLRYRF